jgi:hypothetical protein
MPTVAVKQPDKDSSAEATVIPVNLARGNIVSGEWNQSDRFGHD